MIWWSASFVRTLVVPSCSARGFHLTARSWAPSQNYFEVFGWLPSYDIPSPELTLKYRDLLRKSHPDKFHQKSDSEKAESEEKSRLVNEAYRTLQDPLTRGLHLLDLKGSPLQEGQLDVVSDILTEVYEVNEELTDIQDPKRLQAIKTENDAKIANLIRKVSTAFKKNDIERAKENLSRMKYYTTIEDRIRMVELEIGVVR